MAPKKSEARKGTSQRHDNRRKNKTEDEKPATSNVEKPATTRKATTGTAIDQDPHVLRAIGTALEQYLSQRQETASQQEQNQTACLQSHQRDRYTQPNHCGDRKIKIFSLPVGCEGIEIGNQYPIGNSTNHVGTAHTQNDISPALGGNSTTSKLSDRLGDALRRAGSYDALLKASRGATGRVNESNLPAYSQSHRPVLYRTERRLDGTSYNAGYQNPIPGVPGQWEFHSYDAEDSDEYLARLNVGLQPFGAPHSARPTAEQVYQVRQEWIRRAAVAMEIGAEPPVDLTHGIQLVWVPHNERRRLVTENNGGARSEQAVGRGGDQDQTGAGEGTNGDGRIGAGQVQHSADVEDGLEGAHETRSEVEEKTKKEATNDDERLPQDHSAAVPVEDEDNVADGGKAKPSKQNQRWYYAQESYDTVKASERMNLDRKPEDNAANIIEAPAGSGRITRSYSTDARVLNTNRTNNRLSVSTKARGRGQTRNRPMIRAPEDRQRTSEQQKQSRILPSPVAVREGDVPNRPTSRPPTPYAFHQNPNSAPSQGYPVPPGAEPKTLGSTRREPQPGDRNYIHPGSRPGSGYSSKTAPQANPQARAAQKVTLRDIDLSRLSRPSSLSGTPGDRPIRRQTGPIEISTDDDESSLTSSSSIQVSPVGREKTNSAFPDGESSRENTPAPSDVEQVAGAGNAQDGGGRKRSSSLSSLEPDDDEADFRSKRQKKDESGGEDESVG